MITRHRKCAGCGYDLYGLTPPCKCPECGRKVRVRSPRKSAEKNPKRQAAQYRVLIRRAEKSLRATPLIVSATSVLAATSWWFGWPWGFTAVFGSLCGVAMIGHWSEKQAIQSWKLKAEDLDRMSEANTAGE